MNIGMNSSGRQSLKSTPYRTGQSDIMGRGPPRGGSIIQTTGQIIQIIEDTLRLESTRENYCISEPDRQRNPFTKNVDKSAVKFTVLFEKLRQRLQKVYRHSKCP